MAEVRLRTVDSFTDKPFSGNPAAVVMLDLSPSDDWMAAVARETNLSDTGFVIRERLAEADFRLRWFTQGAVEVDLCGHATLASAHCLLEDGVGSAKVTASRRATSTPRPFCGQKSRPAPAERLFGPVLLKSRRASNSPLVFDVSLLKKGVVMLLVSSSGGIATDLRARTSANPP